MYKGQVVIICGSRTWTDEDIIRETLKGLKSSGGHIGHGAAPGADTIAGRIAIEMGMVVTAVPAQWELGPQAGPHRNRYMLEHFNPKLVIASRMDGESRGTDHMVQIARGAGVPAIVIRPRMGGK